jgi:hypothetical protein
VNKACRKAYQDAAKNQTLGTKESIEAILTALLTSIDGEPCGDSSEHFAEILAPYIGRTSWYRTFRVKRAEKDLAEYINEVGRPVNAEARAEQVDSDQEAG